MTRQGTGWEHFRHMADIGVRGWGPSINSAFEQAGLALTGVVTDPALVQPRESLTIQCRDLDRELLLMDWLNALVYEMSTRKMLFARFRVEIDETGLIAEVWGEPVDVTRHQPAVEVKGATVTCLEVSRDRHGTWRVQCVVDV